MLENVHIGSPAADPYTVTGAWQWKGKIHIVQSVIRVRRTSITNKKINERKFSNSMKMSELNIKKHICAYTMFIPLHYQHYCDITLLGFRKPDNNNSLTSGIRKQPTCPYIKRKLFLFLIRRREKVLMPNSIKNFSFFKHCDCRHVAARRFSKNAKRMRWILSVTRNEISDKAHYL